MKRKRNLRRWGKSEWMDYKSRFYMTNLAIGAGMKAVRTTAQVSQEEVARYLGVCAQTVWRMEAGCRRWYPGEVESFRKAVNFLRSSRV